MNTEISKEKLDWFDSLVLSSGNHADIERGACIMESVAYLAGEPHSDAPKCASKVISRFLITINDRWDDKRRQKLKPYAVKIIGTAANENIELKRAYLCADWAVRECAPMALDAAGLGEWATRLRNHLPVLNRASADSAKTLAREARSAAAAAAYAASYAAYAAANARGCKINLDALDASVMSLLDRLIAVKK